MTDARSVFSAGYTQQVDEGASQGDGQEASRWAFWILLKWLLQMDKQDAVASVVPTPQSTE